MSLATIMRRGRGFEHVVTIGMGWHFGADLPDFQPFEHALAECFEGWFRVNGIGAWRTERERSICWQFTSDLGRDQTVAAVEAIVQAHCGDFGVTWIHFQLAKVWVNHMHIEPAKRPAWLDADLSGRATRCTCAADELDMSHTSDCPEA